MTLTQEGSVGRVRAWPRAAGGRRDAGGTQGRRPPGQHPEGIRSSMQTLDPPQLPLCNLYFEPFSKRDWVSFMCI